MATALALSADGDTEEISARAVSAYEKVAANSDVVIVDGVYLPANALSVEFDLNVQIARDLGLPVVAIVGAQEETVEEAVTAVDVARTELLASKADLLAIIVGRAEPELRDEIENSVKRGDANLPVYVLPEIPELNAPTVGEVAEALKLDTEGIKAEDLGRDIHGIKVAAMNVSNFLNQFVDGDFVIGTDETSVDSVLENVSEAVSDVHDLLGSLNDILGNPRMKESVLGSAENVREVTAHIRDLTAVLGRVALQNEGNMHAMMQEMRTILTNLAATTETVRQMAADGSDGGRAGAQATLLAEPS